MSFLLDTNVVSEWVKPQPNPHVVTWLQKVEEERVASLAEIRRGVELMATGKRRDRGHRAFWHFAPGRGKISVVRGALQEASPPRLGRRP